MSEPRSASGRRASGRRAAVLGASCTASVALAADITAGEHPVHAATLGLVIALVAVLRMRLAGRLGGGFSAMNAALLAQPVLHATLKMLPASEPTTAGPGHAAAEASVTVLHLLVAALIVAAAVSAEQLFLLVAAFAPFTRWMWLLYRTTVRPRPAQPALEPPPLSGDQRSWFAHIPRRGPPAVAAAAA